MADQNTSLPVRTRTNEELQVLTKAGSYVEARQAVAANFNATVVASDLDIRDLTHVSDSVKIGDGTDLLAVNADGSINATVSATNLDIRDLSYTTDSVEVRQATGSNLHAVIDSGTITTITNAVTVSQATAGNLNATVVASDLDIRDLTHVSDSIKIGDGTDFLAISATGNAGVNIAEQTLTAVKISATSAANSSVNPIYVSVVNAASTGEVNDFDTSTAIAAGAMDSHDYSVTVGKTLKLRQVIASASGAMKVVVKVGPSASKVTKVTGFTSMAFPVFDVTFATPIEVTEAGGSEGVFVERTNREDVAMDVYSTVIGEEI